MREILTYLLDQSEDIRRTVNETGDKDNGSYTPLHHASLMPPGSGIPGIILQFGGSKSLFTMGRNLDGEWWSPVDKLQSDVLEISSMSGVSVAMELTDSGLSEVGSV